jgi:hypothetical protein
MLARMEQWQLGGNESDHDAITDKLKRELDFISGKLVADHVASRRNFRRCRIE